MHQTEYNSQQNCQVRAMIISVQNLFFTFTPSKEHKEHLRGHYTKKGLREIMGDREKGQMKICTSAIHQKHVFQVAVIDGHACI